MGFLVDFTKFQLATSLSAVLVVAVILTVAPYAFASSRPNAFPPGPATKPFLGNLHLIPASKSFAVYVPSWCSTSSLTSTTPDSASGRENTALSSGSSSGLPMLLSSTTTKMSKSKRLEITCLPNLATIEQSRRIIGFSRNGAPYTLPGRRTTLQTP